LSGLQQMDSTEKKKAKGLFSDAELDALEQRNPDGFSSGEVIDVFARQGVKFSEATFRKYIQLGLLPRSRRVGRKGKHKGSKGIYPAGIVRQINEIKLMMSFDYTIDDIRRHFAFVGGEVEELRTLLTKIVGRLDQSVSDNGIGSYAKASLNTEIAEVRASSDVLVSKLEDMARRIRELKQLAKEAV